jgi:hypothetical protein
MRPLYNRAVQDVRNEGLGGPMKLRYAVLAALVIVAGCACAIDHITLDERWLPLKRVQKDGTIPPGRYVAKGDLVLCADPCEFARQDIVEQNALLAHEQVHAKTQAVMTVEHYFKRYSWDRGFRHSEEALGWRTQIRWLVRHGRTPNPWTIAKFIDTYDAWASHEDAVAWVASEIAWAKSNR